MSLLYCLLYPTIVKYSIVQYGMVQIHYFTSTVQQGRVHYFTLLVWVRQAVGQSTLLYLTNKMINIKNEPTLLHTLLYFTKQGKVGSRAIFYFTKKKKNSLVIFAFSFVYIQCGQSRVGSRVGSNHSFLILVLQGWQGRVGWAGFWMWDEEQGKVFLAIIAK